MASWLLDKRILLISPQPWDHIPISKHHYAEVLGATNAVFFLEPPDSGLRPGTRETTPTTTPGVQLVRWNPRTPKFFRFHAHGIYKILIGYEAARLTEWLGGGFDLVWCFDFNTFPDLRAFGAGKTLFHPVDPLTHPQHRAIGLSADLILSVSKEILANFDTPEFTARKAVINHGIGPEFAALACSNREKTPTRDSALKCGYFGNLDRRIINIDLLERIVKNHPEITFHFWGPYTESGPFAARLLPRPNSVFHGTVPKAELARTAAQMDCFVLAYKDDDSESDRSNSHKLLEYFASGKAVITTRMHCYDTDGDLLAMSRAPRDADFPSVFADVVSNIAAHNTPAQSAKRKALAASFIYPHNVARIAALLAIPGQ